MTSRCVQFGLAMLALIGVMSMTAPVSAQPSSSTYWSSESIEIRDGLSSDPYPSTISVTDETGVLLQVNVVLQGLSHNFPDDLDIILVSPSQQAVLLMSDAGGGGNVTNLVLEFSDFADHTLSDSGPLQSGTYLPTNYGESDWVLPPAPVGPYLSSLTELNGSDPNGLWALYIMDDSGSDAGNLFAWRIEMLTVDPITTADLALGVLESADPIRAGEPLDFSVSVTNLGPNLAAGVTLNIDIPDDVQVGGFEPDSCAVVGGQVECDLGILFPSERIKVSFQMIPTIAGTLTNSFSVVASGTDLDPFNSMATETTEVTPADVADLKLLMTDLPDPVNVSENYSYHLEVINTGPLDATGVRLTNQLPANMTFVGVESSQGSCERIANEVICDLGNILNGTNATVDIVLRGNLLGSVTNSAVVVSAEGDLTPAQAEEVTSIILPADLFVSQTDSVDPAGVGSNLTYRVVVENLGPGNSTGVILVDQLPVESTFVEAIPSQGSCVEFNGVLTCALGEIEQGDSVEVSVTIVPDLLGNYINTVQVSGNEQEIDTQNNVSTERTTVFPRIGDGILITPSTNALELATAVTSSGSSGIIVKETTLQAHAFGRFTNFFTGEIVEPTSSGLYTVAKEPFTYGLTGLGVVISSGDVNAYNSGPNLFGGQSFGFGIGATTNQEALLDPITASNGRTFNHNDVTQLDIEFDLLPGFDTVQFDVVFGSDEYPEFVNSSFVDGFGIFLNGRNIAFTAGEPININHPDMRAFPGTELDGIIAPDDNPILTFTAFVGSGTTNNQLTFIVSDTSDTALDTTVFISSLQGAVEPNADLAVEIESSAERLTVGSNVTYTVTVTNMGPDTASSVEVLSELPEGVDFVSATPNRGSCALVAPGLVRCEMSSLGNLNSATIKIVGQASSEGLKTNRVSVSANQLDFVAGNNEAEVVGLALNPGTYLNSSPISIFDGAPASIYPSTIQVSNLFGVVTSLEVTLSQLTHPFAADLDILLEGPNGEAVILMSDAGANTSLDDATLTFTTLTNQLLPFDDVIEPGDYAASDFLPEDAFPTPAPPAPYEESLNAFLGVNPNGIWSLYVHDDLGGDFGALADGWRIEVTVGSAGASLSIVQDGGSAILRWVAAEGEYLLEESINLTAIPSPWTTVAIPPVVVNGTNQVTVNLDGSARYFRLRRPEL